MSEYLAQFVPPPFRQAVHYQEEVTPAVERLAAKLPVDRIWDTFSTARYPGQTGGRILFPYYRIDTSLAVCEMALMRARSTKAAEVRKTQGFLEATTSAFNTVAWIEVGFGGLKQLLQNRVAVRNLTVGDNEEHNKGLLLSQKAQYDRVMTDFVAARTERGITDDDFMRYGLLHLLEKFPNPITKE